MRALEGWENFYVIVGSSGGALIGLQFVVITLLADAAIDQVDAQGGSAFATPSVVHFGVVLLLSAIASAPWNGIGPVALLCGLVGFGGIIYTFIVARRMRVQHIYRPVLEDWLFHVLFPMAAYVAVAVAACAAYSQPRPASFLISAAVLLLLFIGIHNAWDAVTYHVFLKKQQRRDDRKQ